MPNSPDSAVDLGNAPDEPATREHTISDVYGVLERGISRNRSSQHSWQDSQELWLLISMISLLAAAVIADRFGSKEIAAILAGFYFLAPVVYLTTNVAGTLKLVIPVLLAPTKHLLRQAAQRVEAKQRIVDELRAYPRELRISAERGLSAELEALEARTGLLVGILDKTGIIPAGVALYLGYLQYLKTGDPSGFGAYLFLTAGLLYGVAFFAGAWRSAVRERLWWLQQVNEL